MGDSFRFSDYVVKGIRHRGMKNKWFADILEVTESSFSYKLKNDSFTVFEIFLLSDLLGICLGKVQEDFKRLKEQYAEDSENKEKEIE